MKRLIFVCLLLLLCGCTTPVLPQDTYDNDGEWWETAVFYEIFIRSFYDSNGDGVGDINGLIQKLDYLNDGNPETQNDLGINAIWLMPVHPSPSYHGYDVLNYYAINPEYGTMQEFQKLLDEAHKRGIYVIIDLVLNHTSNHHPFFNSALGSTESPFHDWYVWSEDNDGNMWYPVTIDGKIKNYYGYFCDCMPDLNYRNPDVTAQMENVAAYWLQQVGVDGFRLDAAKHLIEEGSKSDNTQATHTWFKGFYGFYKGISPQSFVIGEVAGSSARQTVEYADHEMDMIFNFELANGIMNSVKGEANSSLNSAVTFTLQDAPDWEFGTFLTNHDQNRVMSVLNGNIAKAKVAAAILLTSPGTPFIYYGEEIGMEGVKPDEDIRLPMQWNTGINQGFSQGTAWRQSDNMNIKTNVEDELLNNDSLLRFYQEMIRLRERNQALSKGDYIQLKSSNPHVYAAIRTYGNEKVLIIINLSKKLINDYSLTYDGSEIPVGSYLITPIMGEKSDYLLFVTDNGFHGYTPIDSLIPYSTSIYTIFEE